MHIVQSTLCAYCAIDMHRCASSLWTLCICICCAIDMHRFASTHAPHRLSCIAVCWSPCIDMYASTHFGIEHLKLSNRLLCIDVHRHACVHSLFNRTSHMSESVYASMCVWWIASMWLKIITSCEALASSASFEFCSACSAPCLQRRKLRRHR